MIVNISTTWKSFIDKEMKKDYFLKMSKDLDILYKTKYIYPSIDKIFRAFSFFDYEKTKLVILGQDPYYKENMADGLAFSTTLNIVPKSLQNIFKEIYNSTGIIRNNPNLDDWAKQGILLLNTILTVESNKPLSHKDIGWKIFTKNAIEFIDSRNENVIYLLMGKNSINYSRYIKKSKFIFKTNHPSPLSCYINFFGLGVFEKINQILESLKNDLIKW